MQETDTKKRLFLEAIFSMERRASAMNLHGADLRSLRAAATRLDGCILTGAQLSGADWWGATLRGCQLDGANAASNCFVEARLEDSSAEGTNFQQADFRRAHLSETSFARAVLRGANLEESEGAGIVFRGSDLRDTNLRRVDWEAADFRGADLRGAVLSGGRFRAADFRGAIFDPGQLADAEITDATFDHGTQFQTDEKPESAVGKKAEPPGKGADGEREVARLLTDFMDFLPGAVRGGDPADLAGRHQALVSRLTESAGYSPEQGRQLQEFLAGLMQNGNLDLSNLQELIGSMKSDSEEPPMELKAWLEPLMKAVSAAPPSVGAKARGGDPAT